MLENFNIASFITLQDQLHSRVEEIIELIRPYNEENVPNFPRRHFNWYIDFNDISLKYICITWTETWGFGGFEERNYSLNSDYIALSNDEIVSLEKERLLREQYEKKRQRELKLLADLKAKYPNM